MLRRLVQRTWFPAARKSRKRKPSRGGVVGLALSPLSLVFGLATRRRRASADALPVAVIVVGNLTVGGSGKTPLVLALIDALRAEGFTPGVVSRGYGGSLVRKAKAVHEVVSDDVEAADRFGDEPVLMHWKTGAPVFVGKRRLEVAQALIAAHPEVDVLIADDGLQHYGLPRNFEIAVFDERGVGNGRLLPAGPLREPLKRVAAVDAVVLNGAETEVPLLTKGVELTHEPYRMTLEPGAAYRVNDTADTRELQSFRGGRLTAAAGIANPQRFFDTLKKVGLKFHRMPLDDHYAYHHNPFKERTSEAILLTEKDGIKCRRFDESRMWAVPITATIDRALIDAILSHIGGSRKRTST